MLLSVLRVKKNCLFNPFIQNLPPLLLNRYFCHMEVNDQMVDKLAQLARLEFAQDEKKAIKNDLQRMIDFVHKMDEVNTGHVEPLLHIGTSKNVLRIDKAEGMIPTKDAMKNAAVNDGVFFKVPKVIKK